MASRMAQFRRVTIAEKAGELPKQVRVAIHDGKRFGGIKQRGYVQPPKLSVRKAQLKEAYLGKGGRSSWDALTPTQFNGSRPPSPDLHGSLRHCSTAKTKAAVGLTTSELAPDAPFWIVAASPVLA